MKSDEMVPPIPAADSADRPLSDAVHGAELAVTHLAHSDGDDLGFGEFRVSVSFSTSMPIFISHVSEVVGLGSEGQMSDVPTGRVVADDMPYDQSFWDGSVDHDPLNDMDTSSSVLLYQWSLLPAVPVGVTATAPFMTSVGSTGSVEAKMEPLDWIGGVVPHDVEWSEWFPEASLFVVPTTEAIGDVFSAAARVGAGTIAHGIDSSIVVSSGPRPVPSGRGLRSLYNEEVGLNG